MYAWRRFWAHCQVYKRYVYSYGLVCPYTVFFSPLSHLTDVWDPHVSGFFNLPPSLSSHALSPGRAKPGPAAQARRTAGAAIVPCSPRAAPPPYSPPRTLLAPALPLIQLPCAGGGGSRAWPMRHRPRATVLGGREPHREPPRRGVAREPPRREAVGARRSTPGGR
jgi:hypothetical protein